MKAMIDIKEDAIKAMEEITRDQEAAIRRELDGARRFREVFDKFLDAIDPIKSVSKSDSSGE